MASWSVWYLTVVNVLSILWFTELRSYGNDRLCSRRYVPGVDFSRRAMGEDLKFLNGGSAKGPAILPNLSSWSSFCCTMCGSCCTVCEFDEESGFSGPW